MSTPSAVSPASNSNPALRKAKRFGIGVVAFLVLAVILTLVFLRYASYSEGFRVGVIQKVSRKGMLFKTIEGELSQGFIEGAADTNASGVGTRVWTFSVENDKDVLAQIDHAIETNKKVKVYYKERYRKLPWVGDTSFTVYKVEEVQ
jgi:hypothetical protein